MWQPLFASLKNRRRAQSPIPTASKKTISYANTVTGNRPSTLCEHPRELRAPNIPRIPSSLTIFPPLHGFPNRLGNPLLYSSASAHHQRIVPSQISPVGLTYSFTRSEPLTASLLLSGKNAAIVMNLSGVSPHIAPVALSAPSATFAPATFE